MAIKTLNNVSLIKRVVSSKPSALNLFFSQFQHLLFRTIGTCLVIADPPEDQKLAVLNEVWKSLVKLKNPGVNNNTVYIF